MSSWWSQFGEELEARLDTDILPALYASISRSSDEIRARLERRGQVWVNPLEDQHPAGDLLQETSAYWIRRSVRQAGLTGGLGSLMGALSLPPEILAQLIQSLRLAQVLCVVYGFDPDQERGRIMMWRVLAAGYEVELPVEGRMGLSARDLPLALTRHAAPSEELSTWLAQQILKQVLKRLSRRVSRWVPGLGMGLAVWGNRRSRRALGERMQAFAHREWESRSLDLSDGVEVRELPRGMAEPGSSR